MPDGAFIGSGDGLSWELYSVAASAIAKAAYVFEVDQEDTLMIQLTSPEVGLLTLGSLLVARLFPELYPASLTLNKKLIETSNVQEFFDTPSNEGSE